MSKEQLKITFKRLALIGLAYTFVRLVFLLWNRSSFSMDEAGLISQAFLIGLRFDLAALCLLNGPFLLASLLPWRTFQNRTYQRSLRIYFLISNILFLFLNLIDAELYRFTGKRMSMDVFSVGDDIRQQLPNLILSYWKLTLIGVVLATLLWRRYPRLKSVEPKIKSVTPLSRLASISITIALLGLMVLGARGGFQYKPLSPLAAYSGNHSADVSALRLNSTFTLLKSKQLESVRPLGYFEEPGRAVDLLQSEAPATSQLSGRFAGKNVVILILESFALEYVGAANQGEGYTPFLDRLAAKSAFFPHHFANGRRSIEALPSILCSLPSLMTQSFISSNFQTNEIHCLGHALLEKGYQTAFFHGAHKGSMFFDAFSKRSGLEEHHSKENYPHSDDFDGQWGIFDEPFLQHAGQVMTRTKAPFLSVIFTLSSHHPYQVPKSYEGRFPKGTLPIHESIGYTDHSVEKFFEFARQQDWYQNTLFVITADHTQHSDRPEYRDDLGRFRVPLLFFDPSGQLPTGVQSSIAQHADIYPTLMDLMGLETSPRTLFGRALFSDHSGGQAFNYSTNGRYWYLDSDQMLIYNENDRSVQILSHEGTFGIKPLKEGPLGAAGDWTPADMAKIDRFMAILEYFNYGILTNALYKLQAETDANPPSAN